MGMRNRLRVLVTCFALLAFLFDNMAFAFNGISEKTSSLRVMPLDERPGAGLSDDQAAEQAKAQEVMGKIAPLIQQTRDDLSSGVAAFQEKMAADQTNPELSIPVDQLLSNPANAIIQRIDEARDRLDKLEHTPLQVITQLHDLTRKFSLHLRDVFENYFNKPEQANFTTAEQRYARILATADRELTATERAIEQHWAYFQSRSGARGRRLARQLRRRGAPDGQRSAGEQPKGTLEQILLQNPSLAEQGLEWIFGEIFEHFDSVEAMRDANIVVLGPADQLACQQLLLRSGANVIAVGKRLKPGPHSISVEDYAHYFQSQRCSGRIRCIYAKKSLDHRISSWDERVGGLPALITWMYKPMVNKMDPGAIIIQQTTPEEPEARLTPDQAAMVGLEIAKGPYEVSPGGEIITVYRKMADAGRVPATPALREASDIRPSDI